MFTGFYNEDEKRFEVKVYGRELMAYTEVSNHSTTGFAWGFTGPSVSQLACAMFCEVFGDNINDHPINYLVFAQNKLSKMPYDLHWEMSRDDFLKEINDILNKDVVANVYKMVAKAISN